MLNEDLPRVLYNQEKSRTLEPYLPDRRRHNLAQAYNKTQALLQHLTVLVPSRLGYGGDGQRRYLVGRASAGRTVICGNI
jgi:hypothetical protein